MMLARKIVSLSKLSCIDPFTPNAVSRIEGDSACEEIIKELEERGTSSSPSAILLLMLQALEVEASEPRVANAPIECVATLPAACLMPARPTRIVIREMLVASRKSVLAAGYMITEGSDLLPLAHQASARGVRVTLICDRNYGDVDKIIRGWPTDIPRPRLLVNSDTQEGGGGGKMHAKVLIVDEQHLLVTSANFTWHGQAVNIEYGLRISGDPAKKASMFFRYLQEANVLTPVPERWT